MNRTLQDYKSQVKPIWCPGCGNYGIFKAIQQAFFELDLPPEMIAMISGIGCSGRISHFFNTYSLHGTHGRAVPDGPRAQSGPAGPARHGRGRRRGRAEHRRRAHLLTPPGRTPTSPILLLDNEIYGLTKGQASPTTPLDVKTKTSPFGRTESPMDAIPVFVAYEHHVRGAGQRPPRPGADRPHQEGHHPQGLFHRVRPDALRHLPVLDAKTLKSLLKPLPDDHSSGTGSRPSRSGTPTILSIPASFTRSTSRPSRKTSRARSTAAAATGRGRARLDQEAPLRVYLSRPGVGPRPGSEGLDAVPGGEIVEPGLDLCARPARRLPGPGRSGLRCPNRTAFPSGTAPVSLILP